MNDQRGKSSFYLITVYFYAVSLLRIGSNSAGMIAITVKPIDHQKATLYALATVWIPETERLESLLSEEKRS